MKKLLIINFLLFTKIILPAEIAWNKELIRSTKVNNVQGFATSLENVINVNYSDSEGLNALMYSSHNGNKEFVQKLIERHADFNQQDNDGNTALMFAALQDQIEIVEILLLAGADPSIKNNFGKSFTFYLSLENEARFKKYFLSKVCPFLIKDCANLVINYCDHFIIR